MAHGASSTKHNFHCRPADFGAVNSFKKGKGNNPFAVAYSPRASFAGGHNPYDACDASLITCRSQGKAVPCGRQGLIIFARRGGCSFYTKYLNILRATEGKVLGIIISDDKERGPTPLLRLTRGKEEVHALEQKYPDVPVVSVTYREGEEIRDLNSKTYNHMLVAFEFSEHKSVHSWRHKVKEHDLGRKLLHDPLNAKAWTMLGEAQLAQGLGRQGDVDIVNGIASAVQKVAEAKYKTKAKKKKTTKKKKSAPDSGNVVATTIKDRAKDEL